MKYLQYEGSKVGSGLLRFAKGAKNNPRLSNTELNSRRAAIMMRQGYMTFAVAAFMGGAAVLSAGGAVAQTTSDFEFEENLPGNDCAGELGSSFSECAYNGSPIIAKVEFEGEWSENDGGTFSPGSTSWEINSDEFPGVTIDPDDWAFTFTGDDGRVGSFTYTPSNPDLFVGITAFVAKMGTPAGFDVYAATTESGYGFFGTWDNGTGQGTGLSHLSFYDSVVPVPAALPLVLTALGGFAWLRRRQQRAAEEGAVAA